MTQTTVESETILRRAKDVFNTEIDGLATLRDSLGESFVEWVRLCIQTTVRGGKLVLTGVGKSGHISRKIAATLSSTGTRAVFMHPVEAMHGDLGVVSPLDLLVAVSYSGETDELLNVLPSVKRMGVEIVAVTGNVSSRLSQFSDLTVCMHVPREACPFNMAPTTTTTALAALGDALAMVLLDCRQFTMSDFAKLHPAGAIGRSITLCVKDFMRTGDHAPCVTEETSVRDALLAMTAARCGAVAVIDESRAIKGIFTDGDFRRRITQDADVMTKLIRDVMTPNPISINENAMAVEIITLLEKRKIDDILVVDNAGCFAGLVDIQDLPKFKVM